MRIITVFMFTAAGLLFARAVSAGKREDAAARCLPGSSWDECKDGLDSAGLDPSEADAGDSGHEVAVKWSAPWRSLQFRTYDGAGGRITAIDAVGTFDAGPARAALLDWFKSTAGAARSVRATDKDPATHCGVGGWGIGWTSLKSGTPEVQLQLNAPGAKGTKATSLSPEEALIRLAGDGTLHACFLFPDLTRDGGDERLLAVRAYKAFLRSPPGAGQGGAVPSPQATSGGDAKSVPLPPEAQRTLFDVYYVDPKEQAAFAATCGKRAADLNGDSKPEFVVELEMQGGSDGRAYCNYVLLAADGDGYSYVADVDCCDYKMIPAVGGKGGKIQCIEGKEKKTVFAWKGSWSRADKRTTQSKVKADFDKGRELLKAGKLAEAKPLLCSYRNASGSSENPEFANGCATVLLRLKDTVGAEGVLNTAVEHHPDYNAFYANLGTLWELKGDGTKAISFYERYVAAASPGANRDAIKKRIEDLKKGGK